MTDPISPFVNGSLPLGTDPDDVVAYITGAPEWGFTDDPMRAIGTASTRAADAYKRGHTARASLWTKVGMRLNAAAGREPGATLTQLSERFGS